MKRQILAVVSIATAVALPPSAARAGTWSLTKDQYGRPATITDGNWTLSVKPAPVTVGDVTGYQISGYTSGSGVLDLTNVKEEAGLAYDIIEIYKNLFQGNKPVTEFIGPAVISLQDSAFYNNTSITSVCLSAAVRSVGWGAFNSAKNLSVIEPHAFDLLLSVPGSMFASTAVTGAFSFANATKVEASAFKGVKGLTSISLPLVKAIGKDAFNSCTGLTEMNLPVCTSVNESAFYGANAITSLNLPALQSTGYRSFFIMSKLATFSAPSLVSIGNEAFSGCSALTTVEVSPALHDIGYSAFYNAKAITDFSPTTFSNLVEIGASAFSPSGVGGDWSCPALKRLPSKAFSQCKITSFSAPNVTNFPTGLFQNTSSLTNLVLKGGAAMFAEAGAGTDTLSGVKQGCVVTFTAKDAPASLPDKAFYIRDCSKPFIIRVHRSVRAEWEAFCTVLKKKFDASYNRIPNYLPNKKSIYGLIGEYDGSTYIRGEHGNYAFVAAGDGTPGLVLLVR